MIKPNKLTKILPQYQSRLNRDGTGFRLLYQGNLGLLIQRVLLWATFLIFPFGQIPKISLSLEIKISLLDVLIGLFIIISFWTGFKIKQAKKALLFSPGILFIMIACLSLLVNLGRTPQNLLLLGLLYLLRFSFYFLFYLVITQSNFSKKTLHRGLLITGIFVAVFGICQYILYPDLRNLLYLGWDPHYFRLFSTFFDPNFTGIILVLTFFQLIFLYPKKPTTKNKLLYLLMFILLSTSIYLTRSRSTYLSLLLGIIVMFSKSKKFKIQYLLILLVVFFLAGRLPTPKMDVFSLFRIYSSVSRIENWKYSWQLGLRLPLLGQGFGTLRFPDSSFLSVWATTGILGILIFLRMFWRVFSYGFRKNTQVLVILVVLFVSSWFNNTLFYPWVLYWFWLFLAGNEKSRVRR